MRMSTIRDYARNAPLQDFIKVLQKYGDGHGSLFGSNIDHIIEAVATCGNPDMKAKKESLIVDFLAGEGIFKKNTEVTPAVLQQFRDTIAQLTNQVKKLEKTVPEQEFRDTVAQLTNRIEKLEKVAPDQVPPSTPKPPVV